MKIVDAKEHDGFITATVQFPDGKNQTVILPNWATKANIKAEAQRMRDTYEARETAHQPRKDLIDK